LAAMLISGLPASPGVQNSNIFLGSSVSEKTPI